MSRQAERRPPVAVPPVAVAPVSVPPVSVPAVSVPAVDLLVVGAGPTGIAIGAEARMAGLDTVLVDRGPLCATLIRFPTDMVFFTTRDRLEIAGVPFGIPDTKPTRQQALAYYQGVVRRHQIPLAMNEDVVEVRRDGDGFVVATRTTGGSGPLRHRRAGAVALATGYFDLPKTLGVPGEDLPWVHRRYREPWPHFGERVCLVGGGNSVVVAALDLARAGARVTVVHRRDAVKPSVKYWLRPDFDNRVAEGTIEARWQSTVRRFVEARAGRDRGLLLATPGGEELLPADSAFALIGYVPDSDFERRCGIAVDAETLVPDFDPETCETNVPGLYVAGTLQAGRDTGRIFIENARDHGARIVRHLLARRCLGTATAGRAADC